MIYQAIHFDYIKADSYKKLKERLKAHDRYDEKKEYLVEGIDYDTWEVKRLINYNN